jgi:hypothetical protein
MDEIRQQLRTERRVNQTGKEMYRVMIKLVISDGA